MKPKLDDTTVFYVSEFNHIHDSQTKIMVWSVKVCIIDVYQTIIYHFSQPTNAFVDPMQNGSIKLRTIFCCIGAHCSCCVTCSDWATGAAVASGGNATMHISQSINAQSITLYSVWPTEIVRPSQRRLGALNSRLMPHSHSPSKSAHIT